MYLGSDPSNVDYGAIFGGRRQILDRAAERFAADKPADFADFIQANEDWLIPVSYTHLDVYKRQHQRVGAKVNLADGQIVRGTPIQVDTLELGSRNLMSLSLIHICSRFSPIRTWAS